MSHLFGALSGDSPPRMLELSSDIWKGLEGAKFPRRPPSNDEFPVLRLDELLRVRPYRPWQKCMRCCDVCIKTHALADACNKTACVGRHMLYQEKIDVYTLSNYDK